VRGSTLSRGSTRGLIVPAEGDGGGEEGGATGTQMAVAPVDLATSVAGATVTGGAANTKGASYTPLIASTAFASETLSVILPSATSASTVATGVLLDIAIGPADSEVNLISNLMIGYRTGGAVFEFPLAVAQGVRVSARLQGQEASKAVPILLRLDQSGDHSAAATSCTTHGANTTTSCGHIPTAVGSTHTAGSWEDLATGIATAYQSLFVAITGPNSSNIVNATTGFVDIGKRVAGNVTVVAENIPYSLSTSEICLPMANHKAFTVDIPAGADIVMRYRASSVSSSSRPSVAVYGLSRA
jgi:hypothetical protein